MTQEADPVDTETPLNMRLAILLSINTDARPFALQVAMLIPLLAGMLGLFVSFRMLRLPDPVSSNSAEGLALG